MRPCRFGARRPALAPALTSPALLATAPLSLPDAGAAAPAESWVEADVALARASPREHAATATANSRTAIVRRSISDLRGDKSYWDASSARGDSAAAAINR